MSSPYTRSCHFGRCLRLPDLLPDVFFMFLFFVHVPFSSMEDVKPTRATTDDAAQILATVATGNVVLHVAPPPGLPLRIFLQAEPTVLLPNGEIDALDMIASNICPLYTSPSPRD